MLNMSLVRHSVTHYGVWPKMSNQHDVSVQNLTTVEVDNKSILFYTNTN